MTNARGLGPRSVGSRRGSEGQGRSRAAREAAGLHRGYGCVSPWPRAPLAGGFFGSGWTAAKRLMQFGPEPRGLP
ncbi:hypothetical protein NN561_001543 [Cricetulus griseus]